MKIIHYIFYFIYSKLIQHRSRKESVFYASIVFAIFQVFIFFDLSFIIEEFSGYYYNLNELEIMIVFCLFSLLNSYYFYKNRKYVHINKEYGDQTVSRKRIKGLLVVIFFVITMIMYFYLATIRSI